MFAYYGEVSVEFKPKDDKKLFFIYGNNSFGKTSFIRSAKLLFLGTNGIEIPETIRRFAPKIRTQKAFILGNSEWEGILNKAALNERQDNFFVCFEGWFNEKDFVLKRSWENVYDSVKERLYLRLDNEEFFDDEAQEKITTMLPPNFVEFFFFDGEEIEKISDNLRTQLRAKIEEILQISPLDSIIKQAKTYQSELKENEIKNTQKATYIKARRSDLEKIETQIQGTKDLLTKFKQDKDECRAELKEIENKLNKLIADFSVEQERLISQKISIQEKLIATKKDLSESLKYVVFISNESLLNELKNELENLQNAAQKGDIEALKRLTPDIQEIANKQIHAKSYAQALKQSLNEILNELLESMPKMLENKITKECSKIPLSCVKEIEDTLIRTQSCILVKDFTEIKKLNTELKILADEIDSLNTDESTKEKQDKLNASKKECEKRKSELEIKINKFEQDLLKQENDKIIIERDIDNAEISINTERIKNKLDMLESLKECVGAYKERLVRRLREELHDKILSKYKMLFTNDNIAELEIGEDFEIHLKNKDGEAVIVESQSSGQKQILAISIFWALSELSNSQIPIITDTSLSRIDTGNRANIIKHYYAKGSQIIVLPLDSEIGKREFEYAQPYLAGLYKIFNDENRRHAHIKRVSDISEIL